MAPPAFVQPMAPQQFEPFNLEPPIPFNGRNQPVEPPNTAQEINTSIDDLNEVPSKRFVEHILLVNTLCMIYHELFLGRRVYFLKFLWVWA